MPTITFTGSGSVSVKGSVPYSSNHFINHYSQTSLETGEGTLKVTDNNSIDVVEGVLVINNVTKAEAEALRTWIRTDIVFMQNTFSISSDNSESDLGDDKGATITGVNYTKSNDDGVFKFKAPGRYDIKFPYSYKV